MPEEAKSSTMTEKADAAFRQAMVDVVERARRTQTPVIVWEDGRVVEYSAYEMERRIQPKGAGG